MRMRRIISTITILIVLLFIIWAMLGWLLGERSEKTFKAYIRETTETKSSKFISYDLINYHRTLLGARGKLRLRFSNAYLSDVFAALPIHFRMLNGPLFINDSGISTGTSHWRFMIDTSRLSHKQQDNLQAIFPYSNPDFDIAMGFNQQASYASKARTAYARLSLRGLIDLQSESNRGSVLVNDFKVNSAGYRISADKMVMSFQHQKGITKFYKPGTSSLSIPQLNLQLASVDKPFLSEIRAHSTLSSEKNRLSGQINVAMKRKGAHKLPIESAMLRISFNDFPRDSFVAWSRIKEEIDNLKQQINWTLEESGEYPEGQDRIRQLYDQIDRLKKNKMKRISDNLNSNNALIKVDLACKSAAGDSLLKGTVSPDFHFAAFARNEKKSSLLSLIKSNVEVTLADDLFNYLSNKLPLKRKRFKLVFKDNKLLIHQ